MSRLLWRDAQGLDGTVELGAGEVLIGRALDCAVRTEDAMVSRHHARVFLHDGTWVIEDLGSSNGVFFQEQRLGRHVLQHGDAVRCGSLWLRYVDPRLLRDQPSPSSPPPAAPARIAPATSHASTFRPGKPIAPRVETPPQPGAAADVGAEEVARLRRRLEQAQAELRHARGGGEPARALELLEDQLDRVGEEREQYRARAAELEAILASDGGDAKVRKASAIARSAGEIASSLHDVVADLRVNVMTTEGEIDQLADALPPASRDLVREALRNAGRGIDSARELIRKLRSIV